MTAPDRMPEAFENSLHDAGHPHMEPPANPGRFSIVVPIRSRARYLGAVNPYGSCPHRCLLRLNNEPDILFPVDILTANRVITAPLDMQP